MKDNINNIYKLHNISNIMKANKGFIFMSLIFAFALFFVSFASAVSCGDNNIGSFTTNTNITLRQTCSNCTYVTLSSITSPSGILPVNVNMTKNGVDYSYVVNVAVSGGYFYTVFGNKDGVLSSETFCFDVLPYTKSSLLGIDLSSPFVIVMFVVIFLVACVLLFFFKKVVFAGGLFILLGFLLLFSGFNLILSLVIILGGVIALFLK